MTFTVAQIDKLREKISGILSDFRLNHTLGVERMAAKLAKLYCPEKEPLLRAASLLGYVMKQ